jgi:hypothetical protein
MNQQMKCYWRSYIDRDVTGWVLTGDLLSTENLQDRNKNTYSGTDGANDDTTTITEEFDMDWERDVEVFVLKSNLKEFNLQYWNGSAWSHFSPQVSYTTNTEEFLIITLPSSVSTSKIKITATKTILADEEKKIYMFEITKGLATLDIGDIKILQRVEKDTFKNIRGGSVQVIRYPVYSKVKISITKSNLTSSNYTAYETLKNHLLIDSYSIYLYYSDSITLLGKEAYYLVNDAEDFVSSPETDTLAAGVGGKLKLEEA